MCIVHLNSSFELFAFCTCIVRLRPCTSLCAIVFPTILYAFDFKVCKSVNIPHLYKNHIKIILDVNNAKKPEFDAKKLAKNCFRKLLTENLGKYVQCTYVQVFPNFYYSRQKFSA